MNTSSADFFKRNPVVDSLHFSGSGVIYVYLKTTWQDTAYKASSTNNYNWYDLNFIGDKYFFETKYGVFKLPTTEINKLVQNKCSDQYYIRGSLNADSVKCKIEFYCPVPKNKTEDEDEIIFTKIEIISGYKNGIKALQNDLQTAFNNYHFSKKINPNKSAMLFEVLIDNKDSCLKRIELKEGEYSEFTQFIIDELRNNCSWTPSIQGGRPVKSYSKIFVRLNKDKTITVAMPNRD
ncbi:MAG: hypothetical protein QM725_11860 [Lacibacter sp.]